MTLEAMVKEIGRTVRSALMGWPQTVRLIAIMSAATLLIVVSQVFF